MRRLGRVFLVLLTLACASNILHAALSVDQIFRIRIAGNNANGCGYQSGLSSGVDKTDQDAAALSGSNGSTNGTTTFAVTSGTPFSDNTWKGNYIQIVGDGWYAIQSVTDSTHVVVDRATANGGAGRTYGIGGACASPDPLSSSSSAGSPSLTSPLSAGNVVYVQGTAGKTLQNLPTSATYTWNNHFTFPSGAFQSAPTGLIKFLAYNGIVRIDVTGTFASLSGHIWQGFHWVSTGQGGDTVIVQNDLSGGHAVNNWLYDDVFDQNGYGLAGTNIVNIVGCGFINSNTGSAVRGISSPAYYGTAGEPTGANTGRIIGSSFVGWKTVLGTGIIEHPDWLTIEGNSFSNNQGHCIRSGTANLNSSILKNSFYGCTEDAILWYHFPIESSYLVRNNIMVNSGQYGFEIDNTDDSHIPSRFNLPPDWNAYFNNNGGGTGLNISSLLTQGPHDACASGCTTTLSSTPFVDGPNGNLRLNNTAGGGAALKGAGWPTFFVGLP